MPTISTPSKIAATQGYGAEVIFSGSTSEEREAVVEDVIKRTGAVLVPPYDHPNRKSIRPTKHSVLFPNNTRP